MTLVLNQFPPAGPLMLAAAATALRRVRGVPEMPTMELRLTQARVDAANLAAYRDICGFSAGDTLPITYPQVMATTLHMHLLTQAAFPLPLLGIVHIRNTIEQSRELGADESLSFRVYTGALREVRQGLEFDLHTECGPVGEDPVWHAVTTALYKRKSKSKAPSGPRPPPESPVPYGQYFELAAPADLGRRYAKISQDFNPIHMAAWSAKLFGFKRAIIHGMWSLAACTACAQPELGRAPAKLAVQFKRPFFLPGRAAMKYAKNDAGVEFALIGRAANEVHLTGHLS